MFEKIAKRFGSKTTEGAIEGVKESLNDRMDKYSDIIQIGLVVLVIGLGGNKLIGHGRKQQQNAGYLPEPHVNGTPIVINNYYTERPFDKNIYGKRGAKAENGRQGKNYQKR